MAARPRYQHRLRHGKYAGLPWGTVNLENGLLHITQTPVKTPKYATLRPGRRHGIG